MIWKQKLITPATRAGVLGFFEMLRLIRDQCAHPGEYGALLPKGDLVQFINAAKSMRVSLSKSMQAHLVNKGEDW